ncbi:HalOD1 output domain-containing protein [Haladaptatus salinisoli]|uniref:HalOD1 output domain-containing protein n=1 Tax=Haladaptatus salinisoli TaxID=2884876 RepID=UPI001D09F57E|nr:HalOD1 output domain-containing protein [Haladaptatus salinisoli]
MRHSNSDAVHETPTGRTPTNACEIALEALADCDSIDLDSPEFRFYDHVDPDALNDLFAHHPDTIHSVELEIKGVTLEIWEDDGFYARVREDE